LPPELRPPERRRPLGFIMRPLRRASAAADLLARLVITARERGRAPPAPDLFPKTLPHSSDFCAFAFWSRTEAPAIQEEAVRVALDELSGIADLCTARGITLAVIAIPYREQVYVQAEQGESYDLRRPQQWVTAFCESRGIPLLDLYPLFRAEVRARPTRLYLEHDPHFNNEGHALAGRLLAPFARSLCGGKGASAGDKPVDGIPAGP
ncbi:MAG: hypothetical protein KKC51_13625, partial [Verrucomicrobia bacterium]|nr:hypothetical protein [Verrucomicrobiota bacterium]